MDIDKVLIFSIKGKTAHFKKFYSNKSSLTYKIPSRSILMGIIASILKYPRDGYYDIFSPQKAKFGVKIINQSSTHFECMNYLKEDGGHTQVRLQLLIPKKNKLEYKIYFYHEDKKIINKLTKKIKNGQEGYGIYLGQRQFRANTHFHKLENNIKIIKNYKGDLDTLTFQDNISTINIKKGNSLITDKMPLTFKKVNNGREIKEMTDVCYDESGKKINGKFKEVVKINNEIVSFFTPVGGNEIE